MMVFRQFLFREADIGRAKSITAGEAVSAMNPSLNIKPYEAKCAQETEELFSDDFYSGLSVCPNQRQASILYYRLLPAI